jgi:transposase
LYRTYQQLIVGCDLEIEKMLPTFEARTDPVDKPLPPDRKRNRAGKKRRKKNGHPNPGVDLRTETYKLFGVDVTQIPGLEENALPLFSEVGRDMSKWPTAGHFVSWLALCPERHQRWKTAVARSTNGEKSLRPSLPLGSLFPPS